MMKLTQDNSIIRSARILAQLPMGGLIPYEFGEGTREEYLACRETAVLSGTLHMPGRVFDVFGPDADKLMNRVCVNRDFEKLVVGKGRHGILCNEKGQILADGVMYRTEDGRIRTHACSQILQYYIENSGLNVKGEHQDEYFYQIDGPKSLEILEEACQCDLHDLKFAENKTVKICGVDMLVHRLGMSGALAYEMHGPLKDADIVFDKLKEVLFRYGGKLQGAKTYLFLNHTPGGYPNHGLHFDFAHFVSGPELAEYFSKNSFPAQHIGSAADNEQNYYVTPYDIGWGNRVNFNHDFIGKEALLEISKNPPRMPVTLEWNVEDIGDVFMSQFRGRDVEPYDAIENINPISDGFGLFRMRMDYVLSNGRKIGITAGRTFAFYERRMLSLGFIDREFASEGNEVKILWGSLEGPKKEIRAKVAKFPYYNGENRNETLDTNKI